MVGWLVGLVWFGVVWCGVVWFGLVWLGLVGFGLVGWLVGWLVGFIRFKGNLSLLDIFPHFSPGLRQMKLFKPSCLPVGEGHGGTSAPWPLRPVFPIPRLRNHLGDVRGGSHVFAGFGGDFWFSGWLPAIRFLSFLA